MFRGNPKPHTHSGKTHLGGPVNVHINSHRRTIWLRSSCVCRNVIGNNCLRFTRELSRVRQSPEPGAARRQRDRDRANANAAGLHIRRGGMRRKCCVRIKSQAFSQLTRQKLPSARPSLTHIRQIPESVDISARTYTLARISRVV